MTFDLLTIWKLLTSANFLEVMKKLYLVRHSKSSWAHNHIHDMDRPLKGRGIRDANSASTWMREQGESAHKILSSPATRALHTALIFSRQLLYPFKEIDIVPELYDCGPDDIEQVVANLPDEYVSAILFGHNPGMTSYLNRRIENKIDKLPTTGVACLNFEIDRWADAKRHAELVFFDHPKLRKE